MLFGIWIDEALNREELRQELVESVKLQLAKTEDELRALLRARVNFLDQQILNTVRENFVPTKDGY